MIDIKKPIFYLYCYTIGLPSQLIYGVKKGTQLGLDDTVLELSEVEREIFLGWYDDTVIGRSAKRLLDWLYK